MDEHDPKAEDLPELIGGTAKQRLFAETARRSMLATARHNGDHATESLLRATSDPTVILATFRKARAKSRIPEPEPESPAVAALRGRLSAPWWDARKPGR